MSYSNYMHKGKIDNADGMGTGFHGFLEAEHFEIHEGEHYVACAYVTTTAMTTSGYTWLVRSPTASCHFNFRIMTGQNGEWTFAEGATASADGSSVASYNNRRNSANTSSIAIFSGSTLSGGGSVIHHEIIGSDGGTPVGGQGGIERMASEIILKSNETYAITYTPANAGDRASVCMTWYETT